MSIFVSRLSGVLIFLSFIFTVYSYFFYEKQNIVGVIFIWMASFILFFAMKSKRLILFLLFFSFLAFLYSFSNEFYIDYFKAFSINIYLLTLLISVGFLKLIATPRKDKD